MKKYLLFALFIFAPVSLANADLKVAVVDLGKAFDAFYKTKDASNKIDEKKATYQKEIQDQVTEFQHMQDDAKKLYDKSMDQTLAQQARADATSALTQKKQDLLNMQNKIQEMNTERTNEIKDEIVRRHKEILDEITKDITDYSGPQGYDLVIDISAASSTTSVSIVLYHSSKMIDITADIIKQLNATAPAGGTAPTPPPPAPQ